MYKRQVTESMRMDINGNDKKSFTMESLVNRGSDTETDYRLTLESVSYTHLDVYKRQK